MSVDWFSGAVGGALIGLSAALFLLVSGRTTGISGMMSGLLEPRSAAFGWQILFLIGLSLGAAPLAADLIPAANIRPVSITSSTGLLVVAGFCVGLGARIARGCTSGHGVCGLARLSQRSIASVGIFFTTALVTAWLVQ